MNTAQRRHYDAIQQLARDEWPKCRPTLGENRFDRVGTFTTMPDGTIVVDPSEAVE